MGMATVALTYDLVRRRFGRVGGFVAGLTLAITPITVAMSRHNNPDAAVILCCVAALWFAVRALEDGRTKWIVWSGVMVGLGFEAKMGTALLVVPGIAAAWLWASPNRPLRRVRQLLAGGAAMVVVGGAWPLLVALTPAADRPWIAGTADNSIWSLITGYNGVGRISGQSGGPAGGFGAAARRFGGSSGVLRLLERRARRPGRLVARLRARQRHRPGRADPAAPPRSGHRLDDRGRRRVSDLGGRLQRRPGHLPSLLRLVPRPVQCRPGRRRRGPDRQARHARADPWAAGDCGRRRDRDRRVAVRGHAEVARTGSDRRGGTRRDRAADSEPPARAAVRPGHGGRGAFGRAGGLGRRHPRSRHQQHVPGRWPGECR